MTNFAEFLGLETGRSEAVAARNSGMTMVMDQGWPIDFTAGMLQSFGQHLDIVKLWDPLLLAPVDAIRERIDVYKRWNVIVQPGGLILEHARASGNAPAVLDRLAEVGFDAVEMSSTTSTRAGLQQEAELMSQAKGLGLKIFGEVGRKFADGDQTRLTEDTIDIKRTVEEFKALLEAGADQVYWEGHLLRHVMGDDPDAIRAKASTGTQHVIEVVNQVGPENMLLEVSGLRPRANRQWLQFWLIRVFGPSVNIANARIEELGNLEALRSGMHPIFGFGSAGNYSWMRGREQGIHEWWRA